MKSNYVALLAGADAGHFKLPSEVLKARKTLARLDEAASVRPQPDMARVRREFFDAILAAAETGAAWPDPAVLIDAENDLRAYSEWRSAVREAAERAESELNEAIIGDVDGLIVNFLRPAHTEALKVAKANAKLAPLTSPESMAALEGDQRKKVDALARAAATYAAVRRAHEALTRPGRDQRQDSEGVFGEMRNLPELWPTFKSRGPAPWPADPVARLCWIATNGDPWLPTPSEQEAQWLAVYGEAKEQADRNRFALAGFKALGGGGS